ncbi:MAG: hypothetical protein IJR38_05035 [Selenomonadaceae bacterium]|nr:hypothetical protein [Selenomonadaceae bacterium]
MSITIDFSPADMQRLQEQATAGNVSVEEFSRSAIMKAARNAEYLAELERRTKDIREGRNIVSFTDEEWEKFIHEKELS